MGSPDDIGNDGSRPSPVSEKKPVALSNDSVETMECGTSLAEWEHTADAAPQQQHSSATTTRSSLATETISDSISSLRSMLASDIVSSSDPLETFTSPFEVPPEKSFGEKYLKVPLVYCDQTASNRPVRSIERYMERTCLPLYGNTHTNTSITGSQSTAFVAEARQIVAESVNAKVTGKASLDVVLFAGNGATSAVELLIDCLGLKNASMDTASRPVVFVGPHEHHSNLLPWRESGCEIVMVPECEKSQSVNITALEKLLQSPLYEGRLKMGTFCAASNVTGTVCDVDRIAVILHRHEALAFFDYATGAPYLPINMNPAPSDQYPSASLVAKDAIFISPHKMLGGVGTPGILVVKKRLVNQMNPPHKSGGGTVFYVTNTHHRFLSNRIERYEGGTPNVVGIMRAGLTFLLKRKAEERYKLQCDSTSDSKGNSRVPPSILEYDFQIHDRGVETLRKRAPNLILLGRGQRGKHLPIFSFLIKCGKRFLHYNYVCALLNDIFGIQSRGGCQCAGPYSQRLLGLTHVTADGEEVPNENNQLIEHALLHYKERAELLRPGYTRLSLPFKGLRHDEVEYALKALEWVARHGWAMMCQYRCNHRTGEWRHFSRQGKPLGRTERKWLSHYDLLRSHLEQSSTKSVAEGISVEAQLKEALANADALLLVARADQRNISQALSINDENSILGSDGDELEKLRWYVYPKECAKLLSEGQTLVPETESEVVLGAIRPGGLALSDTSALGGEVDASLEATESDLMHNGEGSGSIRRCLSTEADLAGGKSTTHGMKRKKHVTTKSPQPSDDVSTLTLRRMDATSSATRSAIGHTDEMANRTVHTAASPCASLFYFKEGEHAGEAPLEEITAGFNDGELSDECEVYDTDTDKWVPIKEFLSRKKLKTKDNQQTKKSKAAVFKTEVNALDDETKRSKPLSVGESDVGATGSLTNAVDSAPNQRKKPSRDNSTWGQSSFTHISVPLSQLDDTFALSDSATPGSAPSNEDIALEGGHGSASNDGTGCASLLQNENARASGRNKRGRGTKPPPKLMRYITQAIIQWNMIEESDRLLLGLSGGKDSLSLLHCLLEFQRKFPINFTIEVCTIDPMTPSFDPSPLIPYIESLGLTYHYIRDDIVSRASTSGKDGKVVSSLCSFCARMKRGNLYTCARKNNCNKLVLAQHLDDCAESFLMSVMHNGFLRTMKAHYRINAGDIAVIRPMVYCRESLMTEFAKAANLPVINENCPACFEEPKERARIKRLLSREETLYPNIYDNIRRALIPLMHDDATAIMRCYTEETLAKSRKVNTKKKQNKDGNELTSAESSRSGYGVRSSHSSQAAAGTGKESGARQLLSEASEEDLIMELTRRRAERFRLSGAMKRLGGDDNVDQTGQVCSLNGGDGSIPCRELME